MQELSWIAPKANQVTMEISWFCRIQNGFKLSKKKIVMQEEDNICRSKTLAAHKNRDLIFAAIFTSTCGNAFFFKYISMLQRLFCLCDYF